MKQLLQFLRQQHNKKHVVAGDFNFSKVKWEHDCTLNEMVPNINGASQEKKGFLDLLSKMNFIQRNINPSNDRGIYLDLVFAQPRIEMIKLEEFNGAIQQSLITRSVVLKQREIAHPWLLRNAEYSKLHSEWNKARKKKDRQEAVRLHNQKKTSVCHVQACVHEEQNWAKNC